MDKLYLVSGYSFDPIIKGSTVIIVNNYITREKCMVKIVDSLYEGYIGTYYIVEYRDLSELPIKNKQAKILLK